MGLISYYQKFVNDYGKINAPLTLLLKKNIFKWTEEVTQVFSSLKYAMTAMLVFVLLYFNKLFMIKYDTFRVGIGAVLMQEGRPISYTSNALSLSHLSLFVYEKEI